MQVFIVGAGPGDPELITVKGQKLLQTADVIIYAGSLVNPALLALAKQDADDSGTDVNKFKASSKRLVFSNTATLLKIVSHLEL